MHIKIFYCGTKNTKKYIYRSMLQSVALYVTYTWDISQPNMKKYWQRNWTSSEEAADDQN